MRLAKQRRTDLRTASTARREEAGKRPILTTFKNAEVLSVLGSLIGWNPTAPRTLEYEYVRQELEIQEAAFANVLESEIRPENIFCL